MTPQRTRKAYKLFRTLKTRPDEIFPIFIGKTVPTPVGEWVEAESIPTKGFATRPGWHVGNLPIADHLKRKDGTLDPSRVWAEVEIPADVDWQPEADKSRTKDLRDTIPKDGYYSFYRPERQGCEWLIAGALKVNRILSAAEVAEILNN